MSGPVRRTVARRGRRYVVMDPYPAGRPDDPNNVDFWSLFETGVWEPDLDDILAKHLDVGRTFVDIGAWVGPVTLLAAPLCRWVYAIEPDPVAAQYWRDNANLSVWNATLRQAAISAGDPTLIVGHKPGGAWGDSMTSVLFDADVLAVPALTIRQWFAAEGITDVGLIKIDIEGYEAEVLAQASSFLAGIGAPVLVSTHRAYRADPDRYEQLMAGALAGWTVTVVDGDPATFATLLAVPPQHWTKHGCISI